MPQMNATPIEWEAVRLGDYVLYSTTPMGAPIRIEDPEEYRVSKICRLPHGEIILTRDGTQVMPEISSVALNRRGPSVVGLYKLTPLVKTGPPPPARVHMRSTPIEPLDVRPGDLVWTISAGERDHVGPVFDPESYRVSEICWVGDGRWKMSRPGRQHSTEIEVGHGSGHAFRLGKLTYRDEPTAGFLPYLPPLRATAAVPWNWSDRFPWETQLNRTECWTHYGPEDPKVVGRREGVAAGLAAARAIVQEEVDRAMKDRTYFMEMDLSQPAAHADQDYEMLAHLRDLLEEVVVPK